MDNVLYFKLGNVTIWPTQEQVDEYMPESFKRVYPSTRSIIACIIIAWWLLATFPETIIIVNESALHLHYKSHVTYKVLIGISRSGSVTFIIQMYHGSISDREIEQDFLSHFYEQSRQCDGWKWVCHFRWTERAGCGIKNPLFPGKKR